MTLPTPPKETLDISEKSVKMSEDTSLKLALSEWKMLARLRQLGTGSFQVIVMNGEPFILVIGGKIEMLGRVKQI